MVFTESNILVLSLHTRIMLDPVITAGMLLADIILYMSVHLPMDIVMLTSCKKGAPSSSESSFSLPVTAQILAFLPSVAFWILFLASPWLVLSGIYERVALILKSPFSTILQGGGLLLLFLGVVLAGWGRISRGVIAPSRDMPEEYSLSTHGAYGLVRHPLYLSYALFFVGLPLALLTPWLFMLLPGIYGYYLIAEVEETMLTARFGTQYTHYQQEVGMFIPFWGVRK